MHCALFDELTTGTLYQLLKLRSDVFVVEQQDPYPELDGRDREPGTLHLWRTHEGEPVAYLRILEERDGSAKLERVVVEKEMRGSGLGHALMEAALERVGHRPCVLHAQTSQVDFYTRFGFIVAGPEFLSGRVPHLPMVRQP